MGRLEREGPDLRDLLGVVRRRGWVLLLCLLALPTATYFYSRQLEDVYESGVLIAARPTVSDAAALINGDLAGPSEQNDAATARLALTSAVADEAARRLGRPPGTVHLVGTSVDDETGFITLTAQGSTERSAARTANAFAEALAITRERRAERRVAQALADVRQERERATGRLVREDLLNQIRKLKALETAQAQNVQVIEPAAAGVKVAPNVERNTILGAILGLLVGMGLVGLAERLDRKLRRPEELEELAGVPLLATVPRGAFPKGKSDPAHDEAFRTLRDGLLYFNVDQQLTSVLVVSPLKGDGKTTVATNLAIALARAGRRVVLIDADLRHPQVATRLELPASPGLSEVLLGTASSEALQSLPGASGGDLRVLTAGTPPPNPSELLGSQRMAKILEGLVGLADIVIVDTPPVLVVSDAFPLFGQVSGVVAVANLDQTPRDAIRRMLDILATARGGARVLGVVATGSRSANRYGYGPYGEQYAVLPPAGDNGAAPVQPRDPQVR